MAAIMTACSLLLVMTEVLMLIWCKYFNCLLRADLVITDQDFQKWVWYLAFRAFLQGLGFQRMSAQHSLKIAPHPAGVSPFGHLTVEASKILLKSCFKCWESNHLS